MAHVDESRAASAPITSRAVVFETPNSSQMSCSVGGRSARPTSPFTILPARTRVTWSLSLSDWTRAVVIVAKVVWSSCDLTADRTPLVRECQDPPRFEGDAVTRPIQLADVGLPPLDVPETVPAVAAAEFEARIAALLAAVDVDQVVVYGDREHLASLVFLCNLDPRFEEVLLVLGRGRRTLIVGKEDVGYVPIVPIELDVILCPTLSLMGIDRSGGPTVEEALREAGLGSGDRIGVVGWKALLAEESSGTFAPIFAPAFFVDTLREIAGRPELVVDVTAALTSPRSGLRSFCSADQIAVFEWGASRCSAYVMEVLRAARPGVTERETFRGVPWGGEPLSYHPVLASGPDVAVGLRSPSTRRLELGDAAIVGIGLWGGNCARGGIVAATEADLGPQSEGYLDGLAIPYWRAMATWYESARARRTRRRDLPDDHGAARRRVVRLVAQPRSPDPLRGVARLADPRRVDRPDRERHGDPDRHHPDGDPCRLDRELRRHRRDR